MRHAVSYRRENVLILRRGEVSCISSTNVKLFYETYLLKGACSSCLHEAIIVHFEATSIYLQVFDLWDSILYSFSWKGE